ncbi:lipase 2 [Nocardioides sp. OK12]|uniref:SGNH/GDSL hydrolase family protein n=1 Tax=Nocardioides sp. OK12 TaxID=2758661 RepID=UPI0021C3FC11|nr:SGNH/GDSL hydrolase family protein [Nocardioides sp. OK12]GHJ59838.1 lipase 2 [Nocardioides sp. OK12]
MSRRPALLAAATTALALLATLVPATAPALAETTTAERAGVRYVAMGDSYSAASGVLPLDPAAPVQCLRSIRNYPHVIAEAIGARLTDVTCGAADTGDYRGSQYDDVPPQLDALSRRTRLVTMTIGGNDSSVFLNSIVQCGAAGLATLGQGSPCKDEYGDSFVTTIRTTTFPAIRRALRDVQRRAPRAEVAILGYPWIMPERVGCYPLMPVARGDVPYLRTLQRVLNNAVKRAARATGATYVNLNRVSDGHDACQLPGERWVEPVLAGTNPVIVHPNALGEEQMAQRTLAVLGRQ